jgi:hypothetical protein
VKSLLLTVAILLFGLMFFFYRRRLRLAVLVTGGLYLGLTAIRLIVLREEVDRFASLGLAIGGMAAVWLVVNLLTGYVQRRRRGAER